VLLDSAAARTGKQAPLNRPPNPLHPLSCVAASSEGDKLRVLVCGGPDLTDYLLLRKIPDDWFERRNCTGPSENHAWYLWSWRHHTGSAVNGYSGSKP
jgi:hypothetical protein